MNGFTVVVVVTTVTNVLVGRGAVIDVTDLVEEVVESSDDVLPMVVVVVGTGGGRGVVGAGTLVVDIVEDVGEDDGEDVVEGVTVTVTWGAVVVGSRSVVI